MSTPEARDGEADSPTEPFEHTPMGTEELAELEAENERLDAELDEMEEGEEEEPLPTTLDAGGTSSPTSDYDDDDAPVLKRPAAASDQARSVWLIDNPIIPITGTTSIITTPHPTSPPSDFSPIIFTTASISTYPLAIIPPNASLAV